MRTYSLDKRLAAIEEMIPPCALVADIGADHGRLGTHLLLTGRAQRVAFLDISAPSLDKAKALTKRLGLDERVKFYVGDGALPLDESPDCAVIAGMGGETIAGIVEAGRERLKNTVLIMQPNVAQYQLRKRLMATGYAITDECIARAAGRWYTIIQAQPGPAQYDERALLIGPVLLGRRDEALTGYAQFQYRVTAKALNGAVAGGDPIAEELKWTLDQWKEVRTWLQR